MKGSEYLKLKEKISHGNLDLPMEIYKGEFNNTCDFYPHWHDEMELLYIIEGSGEICLDLTFHSINTGDIIIIPKGSLHYMNKNTSVKIKYEAIVFNLSMLINIDFINPLINNELSVINLISPSEFDYAEIYNYFKSITESYHKKDFAFQLQLRGFFFLMFYRLLNSGYIKKPDNKLHNENSKLKKVKTIITYIQENYKNPISISELSDLAKYSEYHFVRFFKLQTGKTCTEFINSFRVQKAAELIVHTDLPITEIAYEVGFGDVSYFIKTFKKYLNISPTNYRKNKGKY